MNNELIVEVKSLANNYKAYAAGLVPPLTALTGVIINWGNTGVWDWTETRIILAGMFVGLVTGVITWLTKAGKAVGEVVPGTEDVINDDELDIEHVGPGDADEVKA